MKIKPAKIMWRLVGTSYILLVLIEQISEEVDTYPSVMGCVTEIELAAIIGKVRKDDAQVDKAGKNTGTETTNGSGSL
jgi:hypothetical protein